MKIFAIALLFISIFSLSFSLARASQDIGFLQKSIWYSKDLFFERDEIRIYSAIFNGGSNDLKGIVEFYDNGQAIGQANFSIAGGGRIEIVWADWIAEGGSHTISAKIIEARLSIIGGEDILLDLGNNIVKDVIEFIDKDTDKDNTGNQQDNDDDNDGILDINEIAQGSDPLDPLNIPAVEPTKQEQTQEPSSIVENITQAVGQTYDTIEQIIRDIVGTTDPGSEQSSAQDSIEEQSESVIEAITQNINEWADEQKQNIETKKQGLKQKLGIGNNKALNYGSFFLFSAAALILEYKPLLYLGLLLVLFAIFVLLRIIFKRVPRA